MDDPAATLDPRVNWSWSQQQCTSTQVEVTGRAERGGVVGGGSTCAARIGKTQSELKTVPSKNELKTIKNFFLFLTDPVALVICQHSGS